MKRAPDGTTRIEFDVRFPAARKGRWRTRAKTQSAAPPLRPVPPQIPRITQLLVLGYHFEQLARDGVVKHYADIARLTGLSRARVTQILNLTLLAPEVQQRILTDRSISQNNSVMEWQLRSLLSAAIWPAHLAPPSSGIII